MRELCEHAFRGIARFPIAVWMGGLIGALTIRIGFWSTIYHSEPLIRMLHRDRGLHPNAPLRFRA